MDNAPQPPAPPPGDRKLPLVAIIAIVALGIPLFLAIVLSVIALAGGVAAYFLAPKSVEERQPQVYVEPAYEEYEPPEPEPLTIPEPPEESEPPPIAAVPVEDEATGSIEASVVKAVMTKNAHGFKYCYEKSLVNDPTLEGKVTIKFVIGTNGMVTKAEVASSTMDHAEVEKCLVGSVKKIRFPEPEGGAVVVSYPMVFAAEG